MTDGVPYVQYRLREVGGSAEVFCWLPIEARIGIGTRLTLKETGEREWLVKDIYREVKVERAGLRKPWKVGGLR